MTLTFKITLAITATLLALIAGLFYSYSVSVNWGLGKLPDPEYLRAMQSINRAILNPLFFLSFMGVLFLLPIITWMAGKEGGYDPSFNLLLTASIFYIVGVFGVTIFGNVPLNEALDRFDIARASLEEISRMRVMFEIPWNKLHMVRTIANIASLIALVIAIVRKY